MANRECNGEFFELKDKLHYRCFWDGSILRLDWFGYPLGNGVECPNCKRKIDAQNIGRPTSFSTVHVHIFESGHVVVT